MFVWSKVQQELATVGIIPNCTRCIPLFTDTDRRDKPLECSMISPLVANIFIRVPHTYIHSCMRTEVHVGMLY